MGVRMIVNYRHSRYHVVRTLSVMFFQLGFAFLIPAILASLNKPEYIFLYKSFANKRCVLKHSLLNFDKSSTVDNMAPEPFTIPISIYEGCMYPSSK